VSVIIESLLYIHKMQSETSFSTLAPPTFEGESYNVWVLRMQSYLIEHFNIESYMIYTITYHKSSNLKNNNMNHENGHQENYSSCKYFEKEGHAPFG